MTEKEKIDYEQENPLVEKKKEFAKAYFTKLQDEVGFLPGLLLSESGTVEDYLTSEWFFDHIKDKAILGMVLQRVLEQGTMQKLDAMKKKLETVKTENELTSLESEILGGVVPQQLSAEQQQEEEKKQQEFSSKLDEELEKIDTKQEKLLVILDKILKYDKTNNVKYQRWGRESLKKGLDCSWLVIYALRQIWLKEMWAEWRAMFSNLKTDKLVKKENSSSLSENITIKPGDLIFWDSKNPKYNFSVGSIPKIKKGDDTYRIHHVAFVKNVDYSSGKITIIESNGINWVTEREVSLEEEKKKKHKSDLYVWHVDYDALVAYNGPKEDILNQAA